MKIKKLLSKLLYKFPLLPSFFIILLVCFISYGQILRMDFYLEDYLILFSIQNPDSPDAGYGSGIIGRPFGYAVTPFIPFYFMFGLNPQGYYFVEIILYFLAALAVYYFAHVLTADKRISLGSALIFSSGYVGSGSLYRLAVGWQNILAAIFISLSGAFYYRYIKSPSINNYIIALSMYIFASEFSYYRAHGIIVVIIVMEMMFNFNRIKSLLRMIPFVLIYWYLYIYSLSGVMDQGSKSGVFMDKVTKDFDVALNSLRTFQNLLIPDVFNVPLFIFIVVFLVLAIWKRSKLLVYSILFTLANYLVYFYNSPESVNETTHRYLTVSFVGISIFWGIMLSKVVKGNNLYFFLCIIIIIINVILGTSEQLKIINNRSIHTKAFWQSFRDQIPSLNRESVVYIDSKIDGISKPARDASVGAGSMSATTSFAAYYGLDWEDIYLAENFNEVLEYLNDGIVKPKNVITVFYDRNKGLINTSEQTNSSLFIESTPLGLESLEDININFSSPLLLTFTTEITVHDTPLSSSSNVNLSQYLGFLSSRRNYYDKTSVSSTTQVKYAEIRNIIDRNVETSWRADDLHWEDTHKEEIVLALGNTEVVGDVRITPANKARTLTVYDFECSVDGLNWKRLEKGRSSCSYIKLVISETVSGGPPQISEIEVIDGRFIDVDLSIAEKMAVNPFEYVSSPEETVMLLEHLRRNGIDAKICIHTDKYTKPVCKDKLFNTFRSHNSFIIDQGGTKLNKIEIQLPSNLNITTENIKLKTLTLKELENRGYIVD